MKTWIKDNIFFLLTCIFIFIAIFFLVYQQIFTNTYESDTQEHLIFMYTHLGNHGVISYPLWHLSSIYISKIFIIPYQFGAIISSAFYVTLWFILVFMYVSIHLHNHTKNQSLLIALSIFIIAPLCIPWYNHVIFMGQGSPNIWHNVTLWTVKPFTLLSIWFMLEGVDKHNRKLLIYSIIFSIISIFAKPSFIIMFLPSLLIYAFILKIYKEKYFILSYLVLSIISIIILLYQYKNTFTQEEGQIIIDFLGVWSLSSPNIPISIVLALAFPLSFSILKTDILNDKYILISWIMTFISIIYYATFAQTGRFYSHGNFGWSYMIAMSLLYLFSIVKFFEIYNSLNKIKKYLLFLILLLQVLTGTYYFFKILQGQNPLYIGIFL